MKSIEKSTFVLERLPLSRLPAAFQSSMLSTGLMITVPITMRGASVGGPKSLGMFV